MKKTRLMQYAVLFLVLASFSLASLGYANAKTGLASAMAASDKKTAAYVDVTDSLFGIKVLGFLKQEKVCALTPEQVAILESTYPVETKTFSVDGHDVSVLFVSGNPISKELLEKTLGSSLGDSCQVVHGNKIVALLSPVVVS